MSSFDNSSIMSDPRGSKEEESQAFGYLSPIDASENQHVLNILVGSENEHEDEFYGAIKASETPKLFGPAQVFSLNQDTFIESTFGNNLIINGRDKESTASCGFPNKGGVYTNGLGSAQTNGNEFEFSLRRNKTANFSNGKEKESNKRKEIGTKECCVNKDEEKGDYRKNVYGHSMKEVIKRYCSKEYESKVKRFHDKLGIEDSKEAKQFYKIREKWSFGLGDIYFLLDPEVGSLNEKVYKKAFLLFYRWFFRSRYSVHVLREGKIEKKEVYLYTKNRLIYLPDIRKDLKLKSNGVRKFYDSFANQCQVFESRQSFVEVSPDSDADRISYDRCL